MSVTGIHALVRDAVSTTITSSDLTCLKYDTWEIRAGNIATIGLLRLGASETPDQKYGIHAVVVPIHVYQVIGGSIESGLAYQETNVENAINALGQDRTLGGKVVHSEFGDDATRPEYYREPNGAAYCVVTFELVVIPFPNVGG